MSAHDNHYLCLRFALFVKFEFLQYFINRKVGKRSSIILIVFLSVCLAVLGFFLYQNNKTVLADPYKAIPTDAWLIIESVDFKGLIKTISGTEGMFGEIAKIKEFGAYNTKLAYLDSLLNSKSISQVFYDTPAIISLHVTEKGNLTPLMIATVSPKTRLRHIREMVRSIPGATINEKKYNGIPVFEVPVNIINKTGSVFVSFCSGLLLCSESEELIKKSIDQTDEGSDIRSVPGFSKILAASGKNEDKLFVVFSNLDKLFRSVMKVGSFDFAKAITGFASCAEGDISLTGNELIINGYTESLDSSQFISKYKNISPVSFNTPKILPAVTVLFETLLLPEANIKGNINPANNPETSSFEALIRPFIGDEVTMAYLDIKGRPVNENSLIIYELKDKNAAEMILTRELSAYYDEKKIENKEYTFYFMPDEQTKIAVYNTPYKDFSNAVIPGFLNSSDINFFTFFDNYLITGNSFVTISQLLYDNLLNKTLANDLTYRDFESTLPSRAGYMFYCVPSGIIDYLSQFLKDEVIKNLNKNIVSLKKIQSAGYQFAFSNGMIYNSLSVQYKDIIREEAGTEWESLLEAPAAIKPFFFTNHNTGAKEIFVQDTNNNIYLLNSAGRILWKTMLTEKISGSVYMIDYYNNGKLQLLFASNNYLHLIDRNGNYVERYPVKLRSPSTNSLSLFDYENNHDYRLFIAGEDKMIYAYDKSGNVVKGWITFKTAGRVSSEIRFFRVSGKDYIVVADETSVYFLDRSGNIRLNTKEPVTKAEKSEIRLTSGSNPSIIFSSPDGTVNNIFFNGAVEKHNFRTFSDGHSFDYFDEDADGIGEYVFIDEGKLYLYDHDRSELFVKDIGSINLRGPLNFTFSGTERGIGIFDEETRLVYLVDKNGDIINGFPVKGSTLFSIMKLSERTGFNLVVGGDNGFLYNYKILNGSK